MKKFSAHKNISIILSSTLIVISNIILSQTSLLLWGEPDPPKDY